MDIVSKLLSNFKGLYNEINSATLTGAIDVVIVQQPDGSYVSSPFHVRFGKIGVLRAREKVVDIEVNGDPVELHMKLGEAGEAFFVHGAELEAEIPAHLATSPLPDSAQLLMEEGLEQMRAGIFPDDALSATLTTPADLWPAAAAAAAVVGGAEEEEGGAMPRDTSDQALFYSSEDLATMAGGGVVAGHQAAPPTDPVVNGESVNLTIERQKHLTGGSDKSTSSLPLSPPRLTAEAPSSGQIVQTVTDGKISGKSKKRKRRKNGKASAVHVASDSTSSSDSGPRSAPEEGVFELELHPDDPGAPPPPPIGVHSAFSPVGAAALAASTPVAGRGAAIAGGTSPLASHGSPSTEPISVEQRLSRTDEWACSQFASDCHPFSDGDISPTLSPVGSRPPSPKSDTEFERLKSDVSGANADLKSDDVNWKWGELPRSGAAPGGASGGAGGGPTDPTAGEDTDPDKKPSGGLFQFMRKTKKMRHQPQQQGIYLDDLDLKDMDPELTALYLYHPKGGGLPTFPDEDAESGTGASLPQSPVNVDAKDDATEQVILRPRPQMGLPSAPSVELALCGALEQCSAQLASEKFLQHLVTFSDLCERPAIITDPRLVILIEGKYYNWQVAGPMVMSLLAFRRPLPDPVVETLCKRHMPKKERRRGWFSWGRSPPLVPHPATSTPTSADPEGVAPPDADPDVKVTEPEGSRPLTEVPTGDDAVVDTAPASTVTSPSSVTDSPRKTVSETALEDEAVAEYEEKPPGGATDVPAGGGHDTVKEKYRKSLKLTSDEIMSLGLRPGCNELTFSVTTQYQGTTRCTSHIYLWRWDDRIIVSDIDGTITRSDVLGHVLPMIGKDWSQAGIANLYTAVARNGYRFLYLSARAIGQSQFTRAYLRSVRQPGNVSLPDGPLLLSPSSLFSALHREVIEKKPEEFKIGCLRDIKALFPDGNPFYAGFGNKINDVWAYQAVGIPMPRVFTVNHKGELRMEMSHTFRSSYDKLNDVVDHFFPPLLGSEDGRVASGNFPAPDEFSTFTYWRTPLPTVSADEVAAMLQATSSDTTASTTATDKK